MKKVKGGFAFPIIVESDNIGVKEEFESIIVDNSIRVNMTFGIDAGYSLLKPAVMFEDSLISLEDMVRNSEEPSVALSRFLKSHKPVYSVLKSVLLICRVIGKYNTAEGAWAEDTIVRFFSPANLGHSKSEDYIICSEVSTVTGLNTMQITGSMFDTIRTNVLNNIKTCISDRTEFICTRSDLQGVL